MGKLRTAATTRSIASAASPGYSGSESTRSQTRSAVGQGPGRSLASAGCRDTGTG